MLNSRVLHYFFIIVLFTSYLSADATALNGIIKYKPLKNRKSVYGELNCRGSTNVASYLNVWLKVFKKIYSSVNYSANFKGSSDGIKALINGDTNVGAASRPIKKSEIVDFIEQKGYEPTEIKVALDALAIYVNRHNKIEKITLQELDAIFSKERKQGYKNPINSWSNIAKTEDINNAINIYLFDKNSGTRAFFKELVMLKGEYDLAKVKQDSLLTTKELINYIASDRYSIGFGSVGINNYKVKKLAISKREHFPTYYPNSKNIKSGKYPLSRYFYIYLDVPPNKKMPKLFYEFCKFILSREGQKVILLKGGLPLSPKDIGSQLVKLRRD